MGLRQSAAPVSAMTGSGSSDFPCAFLGFQTLWFFSRFVCPWIFGTSNALIKWIILMVFKTFLDTIRLITNRASSAYKFEL